MKLKTIFKIALRNLLGKKTRSLITIGGVVVGIAAIVFLVSLGYGIQNLVVERATGLDALLIIDVSTVKSKIVKLNDESIEKFVSYEEVDKVESLVNLPARVNFGGSSTDVVLFSASPEYLTMASIKADWGRVYNEEEEGVIVNTAVLNLMGIEEGNYKGVIDTSTDVEILIQKEVLGDGETIENKTVNKEINIVGVIADNETPYIFVPLQMLKDEGVVNYSQAKVKVKQSEQLNYIREQIESLGFSTSSAADTVAQIDQIFSIFRIILASFGSIALVVSALGMFNTLTVSLLERTKEIGLMKALGAKRKSVFLLFLSESLLISVIGGFFGVLGGWLAGEGVSLLLGQLAKATGNESVDIFYTPVVFTLGIVIFSVFVGFLTGAYPSRRASRLSALDALRYE